MKMIKTRRFEDEHGNVNFKDDNCPAFCRKRNAGQAAEAVCSFYERKIIGRAEIERCSLEEEGNE